MSEQTDDTDIEEQDKPGTDGGELDVSPVNPPEIIPETVAANESSQAEKPADDKISLAELRRLDAQMSLENGQDEPPKNGSLIRVNRPEDASYGNMEPGEIAARLSEITSQGIEVDADRLAARLTAFDVARNLPELLQAGSKVDVGSVLSELTPKEIRALNLDRLTEAGIDIDIVESTRQRGLETGESESRQLPESSSDSEGHERAKETKREYSLDELEALEKQVYQQTGVANALGQIESSKAFDISKLDFSEWKPGEANTSEVLIGRLTELFDKSDAATRSRVWAKLSEVQKYTLTYKIARGSLGSGKEPLEGGYDMKMTEFALSGKTEGALYYELSDRKSDW
jgi:hypothetical protein